jgi:hypothetical protein
VATKGRRKGKLPLFDRRLVENLGMLYDDGRIACDDAALLIRRYYPWGTKTIPYSSIRSVNRRPLSPIRGRWRIWGSGDFKHWWNLDPGRPHKTVALEIDLDRRAVPMITPEDPNAVERILKEHLG